MTKKQYQNKEQTTSNSNNKQPLAISNQQTQHNKLQTTNSNQ